MIPWERMCMCVYNVFVYVRVPPFFQMQKAFHSVYLFILHWFAVFVFHQRLCWLVQNIDSSGKYYSLCSVLVWSFLFVFSVCMFSTGSDECLHFAETRQVPCMKREVCIALPLFFFLVCILHNRIGRHIVLSFVVTIYT